MVHLFYIGTIHKYLYIHVKFSSIVKWISCYYNNLFISLKSWILHLSPFLEQVPYVIRRKALKSHYSYWQNSQGGTGNVNSEGLLSTVSCQDLLSVSNLASFMNQFTTWSEEDSTSRMVCRFLKFPASCKKDIEVSLILLTKFSGKGWGSIDSEGLLSSFVLSWDSEWFSAVLSSDLLKIKSTDWAATSIFMIGITIEHRSCKTNIQFVGFGYYFCRGQRFVNCFWRRTGTK